MTGARHDRWASIKWAGAVAALALALASCSSGSSAVSSATSAAGSIASNVQTAVSSAKDAAGSAVSGAKDAAGSALSNASSKASEAVSSAGGAVSSKVAAATGAATPAGPATVGTTSGALGVYLVDGDGKTLYMYDPDEAAPGTSTCYDGCATAWPPLLTTGAATSTGTAAADKLSTITRTDGSTQVVYGEYPLYYYAKDTAAGQTTGQAVGGKWWVVGADGEPIKTAG
jgi:predicted lipoprotein with Yx(FWY)xxD motif